jgi:hypothetical protein
MNAGEQAASGAAGAGAQLAVTVEPVVVGMPMQKSLKFPAVDDTALNKCKPSAERPSRSLAWPVGVISGL